MNKRSCILISSLSCGSVWTRPERRPRSALKTIVARAKLTRVECQNHSENQEVLRRRQAHHTWAHFTICEEAPALPPRVIISMLQANNGVCPPIGDAIFERCCDGFDQLFGSRPAAVAVPAKLRANRQTPWPVQGPVQWQLCSSPQGARAAREGNIFCSDLIFQCRRDSISPPFGNAVRKEAPKFERGVGLVGTVKERLLEG